MGKNKDAIVILLVIFILLGLAWEPIKNGQFKNTATSTSSNQEKTVYDPYGNPYPSDNYSNSYNQSPSNLYPNEPTRPSNESPYKGKVSLSYVSNLNNPNPSSEYITLNTSISKNETVDITGWTLKSSRTGNWVKLGGASILPLIRPSDNQIFGSNYQDVLLKQGDVVYVVKGFSPIGISFRSNKCSGYLGERKTFTPYLSRTCPLAKNEELPQFSIYLDQDDECQQLISTIPVCRTPQSYMNFSKLSDTLPQTCINYLKTQINYNTCVANHIGDSNFAGREWYLYANVLGPLWRSQSLFAGRLCHRTEAY